MPYITKYDRRDVSTLTQNLPAMDPDITVGGVNYVISCLCDIYLEKKGLSYTNINSLIGVLECIKLELYRRVAIPYEDIKLKENGDVYIAAMEQIKKGNK